MNDGNDKTASTDTEAVAQDRRKFLKKAAKAVTVAPAVTLLLSANTRPAQAGHVASHA
jgi:hypothetical protein